MSKAITRTAEAIADEALEAVRCGKEHAKWIGALMTSICLDVKHNEGRRVDDLAALGQYLADDCANYQDSEAERLQRELDALEVMA